VGECPADWELPFIGELTDLLTNGYVGPSLPHQVDGPANGVRYLQGFNVRPNRLDMTRATWVGSDFHQCNAKSQLKTGDLLIVQSGHIGTAAVVPESAAGSNCHALIIARFRKDEFNPEFAAQYINSEIGQARLRGLAVGSSLPHINMSEIGEFRIPKPTLEEQNAIVDLARAWDTAIEKTEKLIFAKERRHAALVSDLLVKRSKALPKVRIRDIAERVQRKSDGGEFPLLTISSAAGFVRQEDKYSRYMAGESAKTYTLLRAGEFAYNKGNSLRYEFGCVFQLQGYSEALVPSVYVSFKLNEEVCHSFMRHLFAADYLKPQLGALVKTGVRNNGLLNISPEEFLGAKVPLPTYRTQEQIARILDASERDTLGLRKQLAAIQAQKRGLMRQLLTGRWRMKPSKAKAA
jgi:type I restriction enzyme S subunit